jgi:hypothetical protein
MSEITEHIEIDVPKSGSQVVLLDGRFKKYFSVKPSTIPGVEAQVMPIDLGGFLVRLFKSVPKHVGENGELVFYDSNAPVAGRCFCTVSGE